MEFADEYSKLVCIVGAWLAGEPAKDSDDAPSLKGKCISSCERIVDETTMLYVALVAAIRPGAKLAEDGTITWPDAD
jgi:hypothetical protein